jgi:predicted AlkP superfamily pyrophosphatase or phosphodiesterase
MIDLSNLVLPTIISHEIKGILPGKNNILPYYEGLSLANIPNSICHLLGIPEFGSQKISSTILDQINGTYDNVVFLLADGVRLNFFQSFLSKSPWNQILDEAIFSPLTSITPSTTSAALTSLWTGSLPGEHGVVGYEVWLREYGVIANMILHSVTTFLGDVGGLQKAGFDPLKFLPVPTLGPHLLKNEIHPYALQNISIAYSGLSKMLFPGVDVVPYRSNTDLFVSLEELFLNKAMERKYVYIYWESVDTLSHRFGPDNLRVYREFENFSLGLIETIKKIKQISNGKTLFILSSDHGFVHTPKNDRFDLIKYEDINRSLVMVPTGENRLPFLTSKSNHNGDVVKLIKKHFQDDFNVIPSMEAIDKGLFGKGKLHPNLVDRVGDLVLIPQENAYLWWWHKENPLLGRHGGLSQEEMLIPFLALRL